MKFLLRSCLCLLLLGIFDLTAQVNTSDKIQLMADALRARSSGDFVLAKSKLESLIRIVPDDANVQRLLATVNEEIRRQGAGEANQYVATPPGPVPTPVYTPPPVPVATSAPAPVVEPAEAPVEIPVDPALATYEAEQAIIDDLLLRGRAQYIAGDFDSARQTFAEVEARSPNNREAKYFQVEIAKVLQISGALDRQKTKEQMLQEVSQGWQRPQIFDRDFNRTEPEEDSGLQKKLDDIVFPRVSFAALPLSRVVDTLSELSADYDPEGMGVNMVLIDPGGTDPEVTITLRNLPLGRILDFTTESVGYEYDVQGDAVVVRLGQGSGSRLVTEFFPLSRSTIIRLTGVSSTTASSSSRSFDPFAPAPEPSSGSDGQEEEGALKNFLQRAGVAFDSIEGANLAIADAQLIVTQTPRNMEKVRNILRRYSEVKQVEIEARFLEVRQGDLSELGFDWNVSRGGDLQFDPVTGDPVIGPDGQQLRINQDTYSTQGRTLADAFTVSQATNQIEINQAASVTLGEDGDLSAASSGISQVIPQGAPIIPTAIELANGATNLASIAGVIGGAQVDLVLRALERQTGNDLMSAPKVTVLSGKTAGITVGQELRYPESYGDIEAQVGRGDSSSGGSAGVAITAGTPQDFQIRTIGVEMEVTPTVEEDSSISLLLEPLVTEFEGFVEYGGTSVAIAGGTTVTVPSGFFQPIFSVRRVRTEVTIWDGATVVLGGLTREQAVSVSDKVPVLGDIPLLGRLFRSEGSSAEKRNLLIFVTANLISPGGSPQHQRFRTVEPGALFQNPTIVTPGGAVSRGVEESGQ
jgi:general secretion pathway protein D